MINTPRIEKAKQIAYEAHKGQVDKAGAPYINHPLHLAQQMETEDEIIVALLHDVMEDTKITLSDLSTQIGFNFRSNAQSALVLLHREDTDYMDYIEKMKYHPIANKVKLADLRHNSDLTRLETVDDKAKQRVEKYEKAIEILTSAQKEMEQWIDFKKYRYIRDYGLVRMCRVSGSCHRIVGGKLIACITHDMGRRLNDFYSDAFEFSEHDYSGYSEIMRLINHY